MKLLAAWFFGFGVAALALDLLGHPLTGAWEQASFAVVWLGGSGALVAADSR